jgi:outer membrane protein assembly factor BamB
MVSIMVAGRGFASPEATTNTAPPIAKAAPLPLPPPTDLPRPKRLWHSYELHFPTYSAKAVRGETWFSEQDDTVTATNVLSGRRLWRRKINAMWLSVFGAKLIVQADGPKLMALDPSTGSTIWTSSPGCWVEDRLFLGPGDVVIGNFHSGPANHGASAPCVEGHQTLVLSLIDGKLIREKAEAGCLPKQYIGVSRGRAIALRHNVPSKAGGPSAPLSVDATDILTGKELWKVDLQGDFRTGGVIGDVVVLAGRRDVALDAASGRTLWTSDVNHQNPPDDEFRVLDGRFIRITTTAVEAIDPTTGRVAVTFEMPSLAPSVMGPRGLFVDSMLATDGRVTVSLHNYLVTWDATGRHVFQSPVVAYGLGAAVGDIVLAEVRSELGHRAAVTAFRLRNTEPRRRKP